MPQAQPIGKVRATLGMWACVGGPSQRVRKVFVPAQAYTGNDLPSDVYLVPILSYVDGSPVPVGMVAVIKRDVHTPDLCVGMSRLMHTPDVEEG